MDYGYDNPMGRLEEIREKRLRDLKAQGATVLKSVDPSGHIVTHDPETGEALEVSMGRTLGDIISQPIGPKYNTDDVEKMRTICLLEFGWNLDGKTDEEVRKGYAKTIRYLREKRKESLYNTISMSEYHEKGSLTKLFIKVEKKFHKRPLSDQEIEQISKCTQEEDFVLSDSELLSVYLELLSLYLELLGEDKRDEILEMINWIEGYSGDIKKGELAKISEFLKSMEEYSKALEESEPKHTETESTESKSTERKLGETATRWQ